MFGSIGMPELIMIGVVFILIFGPGMARGIGKKLGENIREAKKAAEEIKSSLKE